MICDGFVNCGLARSIIKGVMTGEDARRAIDEGASAVVVSNHGGRQLDSVPASIQVLPEVVAAVNGQIEVLMDGGVRRGSDVIKALCLGARAVLVGRAYAYGLAAGGPAGVTRAIDMLRGEMERNAQIAGVLFSQCAGSLLCERAHESRYPRD